MPKSAIALALLAAALAACGGTTEPDPSGGGLDLSGTWHLVDSTVYDITNTSAGADGLRHVGAFIVSGRADLARVGEGTYSASLAVVVTYLDSVAGSPARRTPQTLTFVNPIVVVNDSIFGLSAGGGIVPPEALPSAARIAWDYDATSEQCLAMIAGFRPVSVSCRQAVRWTR